ncbi:hypothetical protein L1049_002829 [Liquidambar formosana]|uniref:Chalcone/stilbene synthase N-terminal domain-containing protein n=1 Tax=Liquidambar formosana TaxID=63359 RepID=A0AAP0NHX8_LIQFO
MASVEEIRKAQRAQGPATVLAIGTATPPNCVHQADYPDYYFRITNSEHMTDLKEKFKRMSSISNAETLQYERFKQKKYYKKGVQRVPCHGVMRHIHQGSCLPD